MVKIKRNHIDVETVLSNLVWTFGSGIRGTEDDIFIKDCRRICEFTSQGIAWIKDLVDNRYERDRVSASVSVEDFAKNDYNLCYSTYGQIVDVEALLGETRDTDEIMRDIDAARSEVDELDKVINKLIDSIAKEGK